MGGWEEGRKKQNSLPLGTKSCLSEAITYASVGLPPRAPVSPYFSPH